MKNIIELLEHSLDTIYPAMHGTKATKTEVQNINVVKAHMKIETAKTNIEEALKILREV